MYAGLDLGSREIKAVLMESSRIVKTWKFDTMEFYKRYGRKEGGRLVVDLSATGLFPGGVVITATGYGRQTMNIKEAGMIPEITAHVLGAVFLTGLKNFTLLDIGGQDSKVALVRDGRITDFLTNDKCAASNGRYLENMARVLDLSLEELSLYHQDPVELTSTCAIFGESELIGKVVEGCPVASLAAGVNASIYKRIKPMLSKLASTTVVFTGGVAYNEAIRHMIRQEPGVTLIVPEHPELTGAVGCCVAGIERHPWSCREETHDDIIST